MASGVLNGFWLSAWLLGACAAPEIGLVECRDEVDCPAGAWCDGTHSCVTQLELAADANGRVAAGSNFLGVQGSWRASADGYDAAGERAGSCQALGHPSSACSLLTMPDPRVAGFPNQGGALCTSGVAAQVLPLDGQPDYDGMWGADAVLELGTAGAGFDASAAGVRAFSFDIDPPPPAGMQLELVAGGDSPERPADFGAGASLPASPLVPGLNVIRLEQLEALAPGAPLDPSRIRAVRFHAAGNPATSMPFTYCIRHFSLLSAGAEALLAGEPEPGGGPILIDDFEDGDNSPYDERFAPWQFYTFSPQEDPPTSVTLWRDSSAALDSNVGLNFEWALRDPPDGMPNFSGAGFRTLVSNEQVYVDLSRYSRLVLSHRFAPSVSDRVPALSGCSGLQTFAVLVGCPEYGTGFTASVSASTKYVTTSLPFSAFTERNWDQTGAAFEDCIKRIETVNVHLTLSLADGACSQGRLSLDAISIR